MDLDQISKAVESFRPLWNVLEPIKSLSALAIVAQVIRWCWGQYHYVTVTLSCGSFKVRRKDFTWQKLTPLVSRVFYEGEQLSPELRNEILQITGLPIKDVQRASVITEKKRGSDVIVSQKKKKKKTPKKR
ncbi:MAG: hypothetical protein MJZ34_14985 [Paludibacteraceae bacterium]|nr:hypothetical protein [Paludibacteraceae bacterium]